MKKLHSALVAALAACSQNNAVTAVDAGADVPVVTDAPAVTDTPVVTDTPAVTDAPVVTDGGTIPGAEVSYSETRQPCAARNPLRNAYFGDFHVHTSLSFDAYTFENRNDTAAAYRYAQGEQIVLGPLGPNGQPTRPARLSRPLDFAAITDHSEFLGEVNLCTTPGSASYDSVTCRTYREELGIMNPQLSGALAFGLFGAELTMAMPARSALVCGPGDRRCTQAAGTVWQGVQRAAEGAYDRTSACRFTSFVAYEWTGTTGGGNQHRNVIFRNAQVPDLPTSYYEQPTAPGLWSALRQRCGAVQRCDVLAIPHNSNLGSGNMFPADLTADVAQLRASMEPLVEIVQHKGTSECHSAFSANDEACGFELLGGEVCAGSSTTRCVARGDFARHALQTGMSTEARTGTNPYRFGFIGSTDTHNSTPGNTAERGFVGHTTSNDDTPAERTNNTNMDFSPGGLVGVWAVENSRDALFDALRRRETFATSGTRIRVRLFGSWTLPANVCADPALIERGYREGVPMGSLLPTPAGARPTFVVQAAADETPLQRIEIVKVWINAQGQPQERVVTVAGSAQNGASVNPQTCATTPGTGQMSLCATWSDDAFNPAERAAYYARVLENPTCRWSAQDCDNLPPNAPDASVQNCRARTRVIQDRAWSSPIWHAPPR